MLVPRIHVAVVPHAALEDVLLQAEGLVLTQHLQPGVHRHVEDALVVVVLPDELPLLILGPVVQTRVLPRFQVPVNRLIPQIELLHHGHEGTTDPLCGFDEGLLGGGEGLSRVDETAQHGAGVATADEHVHSPNEGRHVDGLQSQLQQQRHRGDALLRPALQDHAERSVDEALHASIILLHSAPDLHAIQEDGDQLHLQDADTKGGGAQRMTELLAASRKSPVLELGGKGSGKWGFPLVPRDAKIGFPNRQVQAALPVEETPTCVS